MTDPHDTRLFRQWVSFAADGSVAAVHEVVAHVEQPLLIAVEVTHLGPRDWAKEDPAVLAPLRAKAVALHAAVVKGARVAVTP